jgi:hypothetical protein
MWSSSIAIASRVASWRSPMRDQRLIAPPRFKDGQIFISGCESGLLSILTVSLAPSIRVGSLGTWP